MLITELIVIGLVVAIIGSIVSLIIMYITDKNFTLNKYTFWKSVFVSYFLTGVITHLIFEYSGGNKWYCINGNACK